MLSLVTAGVLLVVLSGCAGGDDLADQYRSGNQQNYVAGNGAILEIVPDDREDPVEFSGQLDSGSEVSSSDYEGEVLVVNFWYASCPPCRAEAADLEAVNAAFADQGVSFLGVNVRDDQAAAVAFAKKFGVTYPSLLDQEGQVLLAFSGVVAPNAVPTTLVLDREFRVAARILGQIPDRSILEGLIDRVLAEQP
ncbi:alkyl hydroperoxide reductase [Amnibacterium flavum]|uniref:Alkyl hydroperoxide reductase n=1 Tax=Amnibacterium flavum TaxID=2173173 RepID=A0A2V1HSC6_9MICO|nr:alkyl hydroperoxide reductase [Amnibacterium flavum]